MRLNDETRTRLLIPMRLTQDPTGSTLELKIDSTWYPCTWQGTAEQTTELAPATRTMVPVWTQTGRTTSYFAGPLVTSPNGAVVLTLGRHITETRVTWTGGDTIASESSPIDVG